MVLVYEVKWQLQLPLQTWFVGFEHSFKMKIVRGNVASFVAKRFLNSALPSESPLQVAAMKERCILVDRNDRRIGSASKYDCHRVSDKLTIPLHRAFSVFLFNSKEELLLQKRAATKITFPSHVTNTCCSHPIEDIPNELEERDAIGVKLAAKRRLTYELGIPPSEINVDDFLYLTRIIYFSQGDGVWGEHEIDYLLILRKDVTLNLNTDEVSDVTYVNMQSLTTFLETQSAPVTPWFNLVVKHLLPKWWMCLNDLKKFEDHKNIHKFP